jgi:hypothetical protein
MIRSPILLVIVGLGLLVGGFAVLFSIRSLAIVSVFAQLALGLTCYWLGRRSLRGRIVLHLVLSVIMVYLVAGWFSPAGDPYSFLVLLAIDMIYAGIAFVLARRTDRNFDSVPA